MYPGFLGIGAQKAGTTWLHAMLSEHEEIWLPHLKELHYFDRKFPIKQTSAPSGTRPRQSAIARHVSSKLRRINARKLRERLSFRRWGDLVWELRYMFGEWNDEWYASLFDAAKGRLAGEITPAYSGLSEVAISHVHGLIPDAKLILLLRDPIERAWSHAKMDLARAVGRNAADVGEAEYMAHFNGTASLIRGDYLGTIRRWLGSYPEDQLFLGFYDEILSSPEQLMTRIFSYLGVSASAKRLPRSTRTRVNAGERAPIPSQLHRRLAEIYVDDLRELAKRYGAYPQLWLNQCESVLDRPRGR